MHEILINILVINMVHINDLVSDHPIPNVVAFVKVKIIVYHKVTKVIVEASV